MRTERPPVRPRSGRRPLPPLIFLLVLALAALGVWWNVLRTEENNREQVADQAGACATDEAPAPAPSLEPTAVNVRVLNATDVAGLATDVADDLRARGFQVAEVGNDQTGREVTGPGEVRHGARGNDAAAYMALLMPGAGDYLDTRATEQVDLVLGPEFVFPDSLSTAEEMAAGAAPASEAPATC